MHFEKQAQVRALLFDKAFFEIPAKYSNNSDIFSAENAIELTKNTGINKHAIELKKGKQSLFGLIYSLELVELEILKTYIKINLANGFVWGFKSPAKVLILFYRKPNKSFPFYVNYSGPNNITIKN